MSEKNTHSILDSIKKKLNKFDQKPTNQIADFASEFDYVAPVKKDETTAQKISISAQSTNFQTPSLQAEQVTKEESFLEKEKYLSEDTDLDDEVAVKPLLPEFSATTQNKDSLEDFNKDGGEDYENEDDSEDQIEKEIAEELQKEKADSSLVGEGSLNFNELKKDKSEPETASNSASTKDEDLDLDFHDLDLEEVVKERKSEVKEATRPTENHSHDAEIDELEREIQRQKDLAAEAEVEKSDVHLELNEELLGIKKPDQKPDFTTLTPEAQRASYPDLEPMPKLIEPDIFQEAPAQEISEFSFSQNQSQVATEVPTKSNQLFVEQRGIMLNEDTIKQTSNSVKKLLDAKNVVLGISNFSQSPMLSELAIQMLEPKLEKWLNENLSQLVEKIVSEEIKKIIPKD
ncbi:MAG: DUF2497 domain-containing protein [Proteobacteria bacterium]|nr:DUF2497 domain-containing protein [Pseudomonadota bacterium]